MTRPNELKNLRRKWSKELKELKIKKENKG